MCLAQGCNTVPPVRLLREPATHWAVNNSTTEPQRFLQKDVHSVACQQQHFLVQVPLQHLLSVISLRSGIISSEYYSVQCVLIRSSVADN